MGLQRVIVHFMHEHEQVLAQQLVPRGFVTEGTVVGEIDDAHLPQLQAAGILVQRIDSAPRPRLTRRSAAAPRAVGAPAMAGFGGGATAAPAAPVAPAAPPGSAAQYRMRFTGPLVGTQRADVEASGARILEALADYEARVLLLPADHAAVRALPFVAALDPWDADAEGDAAGVMPAAPAPGGILEPVPFDVLLVDDAFQADVAAWLHQRRVLVAGAGGDKVRIYVDASSTIPSELLQRTDWVVHVEPYVRPTMHNDRARVLLGVDPRAAAAVPPFPFEGAGEIVGVADTGLDEQHPDFTGRLASVIALGRPGDASDPHGHGTHVAGSIAGDGRSSGGLMRGVAPQAQIVFQSVLDAAGGLGGLPFRLQDLFQEAYDLGARIHNNSWGAATGSSYRVNCREVDEFVHAHKDMLIVISAGNEGTAVDPPIGARSSRPGFVDWLTIGSPATAKNALTVGASRSDRTSGGLSEMTYGQAWPQNFPVDPIRDQFVSRDVEALSGFSSRGPCDDYRIKPDVVAPGTDIVSCRSSRAPLRNYWGPYPPSPKYAYMGGTSMSAPLVAGCAALVREYYVKRRGHVPSAALLKATLINGTRWLTGGDAVADHPSQPNYHQGFGCIHVAGALPELADAAQQLHFVDNWQDPATQLSTGQRRRYEFTLAAAGPLRLCLVHTDPPSRALQNNLNLLLERPGGGPKLYGNMQLPMSLNQPDAVNNVEVLRIDAAPPGRYLIQVTGTSILRGPQDFALVVTGPLAGPLVPRP